MRASVKASMSSGEKRPIMPMPPLMPRPIPGPPPKSPRANWSRIWPRPNSPRSCAAAAAVSAVVAARTIITRFMAEAPVIVPLQAARGGITVAWRKDEIPVRSDGTSSAGKSGAASKPFWRRRRCSSDRRRTEPGPRRGVRLVAVLTITGIEEVCEAKGITLVMHPCVRRAVKPYEESFYIGACCFLGNETDGIYFLPLGNGGYVRLLFTKRRSAAGHPLLRVEPAAADGMQRIRNAVGERER